MDRPGLEYVGTLQNGQFTRREYMIREFKGAELHAEEHDDGTFVRIIGGGTTTGYDVAEFDEEKFREYGIQYDPVAQLLKHWKEIIMSKFAWKGFREESQRREANAGKPALPGPLDETTEA